MGSHLADTQLATLIRQNLWMATAGDDFAPRPGLDGDTAADVAIVGGGFSGLWTAYYLAKAQPDLRIAVLEAQIAGFGASGRNGGWCSALFPQSLPALSRRHGRAAAIAMYRAMQSSVDEVGAAAATERIDCDFDKGGTVVLCRSPAQLHRAHQEVAQARDFGFGPQDLAFLDAPAAAAHCNATGVLGGTYTPHCAAIHPAKLARGLARAVQRLGVKIYERTPVRSIVPGAAHTATGIVRAAIVVRATEGYTASLAGLRRRLAPIYSLMVATAPLPEQFWRGAGLARRETFSDHRHLIIYGQRTADGRFAFGGRGAPYHFGSRVHARFDSAALVHAELARTLRTLFPGIGGVEFTHAWGGPLGVAPDWTASVGLDRATGLAWAGGYVGDGVSTTNLAGRTLADLILARDSDLVRLPWVNHRSPSWPPEPLRWLGVNLGLRLMSSADVAEARTGRPARRAQVVGRLLGH